MRQKVLLIGASSGIGYQTAEGLTKAGHKAYTVARRTESIGRRSNRTLRIH